MLLLALLACSPSEGDIHHEAIAGGTLRVRISGDLVADLTMPGATQNELNALTSGDFDFPWPMGGRSMRVRDSKLDTPIDPATPWSVTAIGDGLSLQPQFAAKNGGWLGVDYDGQKLGMSIGLYEQYAGDSGWTLHTTTPRQVVGPNGAVTASGDIVKNGTDTVGTATVELTWDFNPSVTRSWTHRWHRRGAL